MKKIILVAAMVLGFAAAAVAQPRAIGVRIGNGGEVSYQHTLGNNFLEVDGGLGLGLERLTMHLLGAKNVREATMFPRDINRVSP
jgi:hypothetical protein